MGFVLEVEVKGEIYGRKSTSWTELSTPHFFTPALPIPVRPCPFLSLSSEGTQKGWATQAAVAAYQMREMHPRHGVN